MLDACGELFPLDDAIVLFLTKMYICLLFKAFFSTKVFFNVKRLNCPALQRTFSDSVNHCLNFRPPWSCTKSLKGPADFNDIFVLLKNPWIFFILAWVEIHELLKTSWNFRTKLVRDSLNALYVRKIYVNTVNMCAECLAESFLPTFKTLFQQLPDEYPSKW